METKDISIYKFNKADTETLSSIIEEHLADQGILTKGFCFSLEVSYDPDDEDN